VKAAFFTTLAKQQQKLLAPFWHLSQNSASVAKANYGTFILIDWQQ
jgi:hypothetical protein